MCSQTSCDCRVRAHRAACAHESMSESEIERSQPVMDAMADARVRVVISVQAPYGRVPGMRL